METLGMSGWPGGFVLPLPFPGPPGCSCWGPSPSDSANLGGGTFATSLLLGRHFALEACGCDISQRKLVTRWHFPFEADISNL